MISQIDIVDQISSQLNSLKNSILKNEMWRTIPQTITVGDQSAGKSAVFSRIIGHNLPSKAGMCTRVPTKINTRINDKSKNQVKIISNLESKEEVIEYFDNFVLANLVENSQEKIMQKLEKKKFSDDFMISVDIFKHNYDLMFIDLPGLVAFDSENTNNPLNDIFPIVKKYIQGDSKNIIFHIIDPTKEKEIINSLNFVKGVLSKDLQNLCINILTKIDMLNTTHVENYKKIMKELDPKSTFIMLGIFKDYDNNDDEILKIKSKLDELKIDVSVSNIGREAVCKFLENQIKLNIKNNMHLLEKKVLKEFKSLSQRLYYGDLVEFNSTIQLSNLLEKIQSIFKSIYKDNYHEEFKIIKSKMIEQIKKFELDSILKRGPEILNNYNLKENEIIFYFDPRDNNYYKTRAKSVNSTTSGWFYFTDRDGNTYWNNTKIKITDSISRSTIGIEQSNFNTTNTNMFANSSSKINTDKHVFSVGYHNPEALKNTAMLETNSNTRDHPIEKNFKFYTSCIETDVITNIKRIMDKSGWNEHNLHKAPFEVIKEYSKNFAEYYRAVLEKTHSEIQNLLYKLLENIFIDIPRSELIKRIILNICGKLSFQFERDLNTIFLKNKKKRRITTSNDHYLTSLFTDGLSEINSKTDDAVYLIAYYHVESFIKTQIKYVQEYANDMLIRYYDDSIYSK